MPTLNATEPSYGYDQAGNAVTRPGPAGTQTLTWDAEGHLGAVTDSEGTSGYVYDVSGNRLVGHDSAGSTLYLPGMEVHLSTANQVTATRYYTSGRRPWHNATPPA